MVSSDLQWMLIQRQSSFILKRHGRVFSRDPGNLLGRNSKKYNSLVNGKTLSVEPATDGKGVVIVTKKSKAHRYPAKSQVKVPMNKGGRRTLTKVKRIVRKNRNRRDLERAACRRVSAILRSQQRSVASGSATTTSKKK